MQYLREMAPFLNQFLARPLAVALAALIAVACGPQPDMAQVIEIQGGGWHQDSLVIFDVAVEDSSQVYRVMVQVTTDESYPYQNLYLFRDILSEARTEYQDSLHVQLASPQGVWHGNGVGALKTLEFPYLQTGLRFPLKGHYLFRFQHGMRDVNLPGVTSIALTLYPEDAP